MSGNANSGGRNAKGTRFHVLAGTFRKDRHGDRPSPDPPSGVPTPPKALSAEAKAEWDRMIDSLEKSRTLSVVDHHALYQYVQLFAETEAIQVDAIEARKLSRELKKAAQRLDGRDLLEAIGKVVELQKMISSQTTKLRQQRMALRQYLVEFGLTPSARSRVKPSDKQAPGNPLEDLMKRAGR